MSAGPRRERQPLFKFASELDPDRAMSTAALIVMALIGDALMLVLALSVGPLTIEPAWLVAGAVVGVANVLLSFRDVRTMTDSGGRITASPVRVLCEMALWTVAVGAVSHGLGSGPALMAAALLPVGIVWVVLGNTFMSAVGVASALVLIAIEAVVHPATDAPALRVFLIVTASGLTVALMVKLVSALSVRAIADFSLLNDMGAVATRSLSLESGLDAFMLMASDLVRADQVTAYRIPAAAFGARPEGDDSSWALSHWDRHQESATAAMAREVGAPLPLDAIRVATSGARSEADDAWIWARATDGSVVVLRFLARRRWYQPQVSWQYAFDRIAPELESLVTLTGFISQLSEMTRTDYLTGLANRRAFMDRLDQEVRKVARHPDALTVAMLDLDNFKLFNDEHGHLLGDQLLRGFAALLTSRGRAIDLAARYGGEEFCLILPSTDGAGARQLMADLHEASRRLREPMGVTFSAGLATWEPGDDPERLLARADVGLYQAKSLGRDRTVVADRHLETDEAGPR